MMEPTDTNMFAGGLRKESHINIKTHEALENYRVQVFCHKRFRQLQNVNIKK